MIEPSFPPARKLKRGLQDLSPLFRSPPPDLSTTVPRSPRALEVQFLTVCVPDSCGDAFLANAYVASRIVGETDSPTSLISIDPASRSNVPPRRDWPLAVEPLNSRISRLTLSSRELWDLTQHRGGAGETLSSPYHLIFLEFESSQCRDLPRMALLLDRVIFFVPPRVESLREAYRMIKIFWNLNREIEFLLLFREERSHGRGEAYLFERFCLISSRFLGVSIGWMGHLPFPKERGEILASATAGLDLQLDPLMAPRGRDRSLSPEKSRLCSELARLLRGGVSVRPPFSLNTDSWPESSPYEACPESNGARWARLVREELSEFIQLKLDLDQVTNRVAGE